MPFGPSCTWHVVRWGENYTDRLVKSKRHQSFFAIINPAPPGLGWCLLAASGTWRHSVSTAPYTLRRGKFLKSVEAEA